MDFAFTFESLFLQLLTLTLLNDLQIIDTFSDSVMSCCLTKTEIIAGSVDGTVRTFDIRMGRYVYNLESYVYLS